VRTWLHSGPVQSIGGEDHTISTHRDKSTIAVGDAKESFGSSRSLAHPVCAIGRAGNRASESNRHKGVVPVSHAREAIGRRERIAPVPLVQWVGTQGEPREEHQQTKAQ